MSELDETCDLAESLAGLTKAVEESQSDRVLSPRHGLDDMEYPMEVSNIRLGRMGMDEPLSANIGDFVAVRPIAEEHEKKTFLGIMLGDFPIDMLVSWSPTTKELTVCQQTNPAMFVPDLNKVVFGYESWWGKIKDESHLKQITDEDINNVWYVKALKKLMGIQSSNETTS